MAIFKFKFQTLYKLKEQIEENAKNELGKAIRHLEDQRKALRETEVKQMEVFNYINKKSEEGISAGKIKEYFGFASKLKKKIELQKENINHANQIVDKCRATLIEAVKERKIFEKLKERKLEEFLIEEKKAEQKVVDEVVSFKTTIKGYGGEDI